MLFTCCVANTQIPDWRFGFENNELDPPVWCTEAQFDTLMSRMAFINSAQGNSGGVNTNGIGGGWDYMQTASGAPIDFSLSDQQISRFQRGGLEVVFELNPTAAWAQIGNPNCINGLGDDECAPGPDFWSDWSDYIRQLAERYDGDGIDDMPGLTIPVRFYTMTQEVYFAGDATGDAGEALGNGYWDDNMDDLIQLHKVTYEAIQEANANGGHTQLESSGGLLFDLWADFPDYPDPSGPTFYDRINGNNISSATYNKGVDSLIKLLTALNDTTDGKLCDFIGWHPHSNWKSIDMTFAWVRQYTDIPFFIDDMWPQLMPTTYPNDGWYQFVHVEDSERDFPAPLVPDILTLYNGLNSGDADVTAWYNAKTARDLVKSFVVAFYWGAERVEYSGDCDNPLYQGWGAGNPFSVLGWSNLCKTRNDNYALKPQGNTMKIMVDMLHDFTSVTKVDVSDNPYTRCYKFSRARGTDCYVMWSEAVADPPDPHIPNGETITIPVISGHLTETHIITDGGTEPETEDISTPGHSLSIQLGFEPVFFEETEMTSTVQDFAMVPVRIYPDPVYNTLHIQTQADWTYAEIRDMEGRIVRRETRNNYVTDIASLASGLYCILLFDVQHRLLGSADFVKE